MGRTTFCAGGTDFDSGERCVVSKGLLDFNAPAIRMDLQRAMSNTVWMAYSTREADHDVTCHELLHSKFKQLEARGQLHV